MKKDYVLFRFVPTMRCNFRCNYCFLHEDIKRQKETMFDIHPVEEWIQAMELFQDKEVEFYFWGGEPFVLDDTYTLVREWTKMDHIISGCRIDTNIFFADKIAELCPSNKIKLNCSFHMQYHTLEEQYNKIKRLKKLDMVGMMNFVASEYNLRELKNKYNMSVKDLINKFGELGVYVNIAGDFAITNNINYPKHREYKEYILQYISPEEWSFLRMEKKGAVCEAGKFYFTVDSNGKISSCVDDKVYGDFFKGELTSAIEGKVCNKKCASLISYPFRTDNNFSYQSHILDYVDRNTVYRSCRESNNKEFNF